MKTRQILHPPRPLAPTTVRLAQGSVGKCYPCSLCRKPAPHDRVICSTWLSTAGPSFSTGSITVLGTPSGVPWAQQSTLACRLPPSCSGRLVFSPSGTGPSTAFIEGFWRGSPLRDVGNLACYNFAAKPAVCAKFLVAAAKPEAQLSPCDLGGASSEKIHLLLPPR